MTQLFKTVACFTDIHFGLKNNSYEHNDNCTDFVDWFIAQAKAANAETCIFLGDWHHFRSHINVATMNYTLENLTKLNDNFETTYFITGNHDLFYKDRRDLNSIEFGKLFPNVILVKQPLTKGDVTILPWLVQEEWKSVNKINSKYVFGHLELPHFKMNAMIEMPDHGNIQIEHFKGVEYVFSGHFHKRQRKNNIIYIGNPFPHSFSDAWDDERGMMLLNWDGEPKFINYQNGPKYRNMTLSQLLTNPTYFLDHKTHAKVVIDLPLNYEEMNFVKEVLVSGLKVKELTLIQEKNDEYKTEGTDLQFQTVDQIVNDSIDGLDSETYDKSLLLNIYRSLEEE